MVDATETVGLYRQTSPAGVTTETVGPNGVINIDTGGALQVAGVDKTAALAAAVANPSAGLAAGYKIARGVHQQAAASDTVVSGLATVVAVVVSFRDTPTVKQMFVTASIGDQAGAPAAGSFLIKSFAPTANNNVTPTAASDFTDNINFDWIAIGT
jgi:hypothetical protein